jgi:hypothetical protein
MSAQITRKQHYVPQFLLKNFSCDKKRKKINVFNLNDCSFDLVDDPNVDERAILIKNRFQREFFYDTDNLIEDFLEAKIETPASEVIRSIVSENKVDLSSEEKTKLFYFIASLLSRTTEALKQADAAINSFINSTVRELLRLNGKDEDAADDGRLVVDEQNLICISALAGAAKHQALHDLELAFIVNRSKTDFYISDHPVFSYNWLYRKSSHPEVTSILARGFQIFFPISYSLTLCLYDPEVYKYGQRGKRIIEVENSTDIDILNSFQVSNADSCIGFRSAFSVPNLKQLHKRYGTRKVQRCETLLTSRHWDSKTQMRSRHLTVRRQLELDRMPSFITTKKVRKKDTDSVSLRNPLLAQAFYELDRENSDYRQKQNLSDIDIDINILRAQLKAKISGK